MKFTFTFPDATPDQKWNQFRLYRLAQMQMSDFTRADDCQLPEDVKQAVFDYCQFLRDCPDIYQTVEEIPFPGYMAQVDYKIVFVAEPYTLG